MQETKFLMAAHSHSALPYIVRLVLHPLVPIDSQQ